MFSEVADTVKNVDLAFLVIFSMCIFFLVFNTAIMIYFCWRYSRKRNPVPTQMHGHLGLELFWTIVPTILVMGLFYFGLGFQKDHLVPADALTVKVTARMWSWTYEYGNGKITDHLVVPVGRAVKLIMTAPENDVLHSYYIPAFRIKRDVIPNQNTMLWFTPKITGEYVVFCAEYCGLKHSQMLSKVVVVSPDEFKEFYGDEAPAVLAGPEAGNRVALAKGCLGCHSTDGSRMVGPSFKGLWNRKATVVASGSKKEIVADEAYIKKAIREPAAEVVDGYPNAMLVIDISDEEIGQLIEYFKSL